MLHKWKEARTEYEKLISMLKDPGNPTRQHALVLSAECRQHPKAAPSLLAHLDLSDPEADAERLYLLSQAYRSEKNESGDAHQHRKGRRKISARAIGPKNP